MADHSVLAAMAKRLVDKNGRSVTLVKFAQEPADNTKLWLGPTAPRGADAELVVLTAAFLPPPTLQTKLGTRVVDIDLLKKTDLMAVVAPGPNQQTPLELFNELRDDNVVYRIEWVEMLRPADVRMVYFFGLCR